MTRHLIIITKAHSPLGQIVATPAAFRSTQPILHRTKQIGDAIMTEAPDTDIDADRHIETFTATWQGITLEITYASLEAAYDHFNEGLFDGTLPPCLITVQRHKSSYGYFSGDRFASTTDPGDITDEIALNPQHFASRSAEEVLSTLAHEMVHLWQHRFGKPPRKAYHDRQWAAKMRDIGLIPSDTGAPGGKETGQKMTHYIEEGGCFARACAGFLAVYPATLYQDRAAEDPEARKARKKKAASKTKFTCPSCGANAWGKPELQLVCGACDEGMEVEPMPEDKAQSALQAEFGQSVFKEGREVDEAEELCADQVSNPAVGLLLEWI